MPENKPRYFVEKPGADGPRYYWQPPKKLRQAGFLPERLPTQMGQAITRAEVLNRHLDACRYPTQGDTALVPILPGRTRGRGDPRKQSVYVIGAEGGGAPVKIGRSYNAFRRMQDLSVAQHQKLRIWLSLSFPAIDAGHLEAHVHKALSSKRAAGEWFNVLPETAIKEVIRCAFELSRRPDLSATGTD